MTRRKLAPEADLFYRSTETTVYLIHFDRKIGHAQHYIGSTTDLERRLQEHQRKWPRYRLTGKDVDKLDALDIFSEDEIDLLLLVGGRTFRRKTTFLAAIARCLERPLAAYEALAFCKVAKKHTSNGLVMAANQQRIPWRLAVTWQANRAFEMMLKRGKHAQRLCPICCGEGAASLPGYIPF